MNMHMADLGWTEERVDTLKRMHAEGHSASQIAMALGGGATRNAVIGKATRLKLPKRGNNPTKASSAHARAPKIAERKRVREALKIVPAKVRVEAPIIPAVVHRLPTKPGTALRTIVDEIEGVPFPRTKTFGVCAWPLWGDDTPIDDRRCCGAGTIDGSSYCQMHAGRAAGR
jgi:GcrA cell cycle regulator